MSKEYLIFFFGIEGCAESDTSNQVIIKTKKRAGNPTRLARKGDVTYFFSAARIILTESRCARNSGKCLAAKDCISASL